VCSLSQADPLKGTWIESVLSAIFILYQHVRMGLTSSQFFAKSVLKFSILIWQSRQQNINLLMRFIMYFNLPEYIALC
jgi:hypothetical protein